MQIWSINYYILEVSNIVYVGRYLVLTYMEIFFQQFAAFLATFVGQ